MDIVGILPEEYSWIQFFGSEALTILVCSGYYCIYLCEPVFIMVMPKFSALCIYLESAQWEHLLTKCEPDFSQESTILNFPAFVRP